MPKINVYLSDELADAVKEANLPVSAICQRALEQAVRRVTAIHEAVHSDVSDDLGSQIHDFNRFTRRLGAVVAMAVEEARSADRAVGTDNLLAALVDEGRNLALLVLRALEIEPQELTAALVNRHRAGGDGGFAADAKTALRLAVTEAAALGHNYVGTEHLLLGLIAEPDGAAGQLLRGAGTDLRMARRAAVAAIAGWLAQRETTASEPPDVVAALAAAVRLQLEPIVTRLDQIEQRLPA